MGTFLFAQPCGAHRPLQKEKGAHVNVGPPRKQTTRPLLNIDYLNMHLLITPHRAMGAGAADAQRQQRLTQDHDSPP